MLTQQAKQTLYNNLSPNMEKEYLNEKIDLFEKVLLLAPTCEKLANLDKLMFEELNNGHYNLEQIAQNEKFLKLILFIVNKEKFNYVIDNAKGLAVVYRELNIMSNDEISAMCPTKWENGKTISLTPILDLEDPRHPEQVFKNNKKLLPYVKAYVYRNEISHISKELPMPKRMDYYINILISCIEVSWRYRREIMDYYVNNTINLKDYINKIINDYQEQKTFTYIPSTVTPWNDTLKNITIDESDKNLINIINNHNIKTMKIIGYAGAGKTTSLKYIEYQNALECKKQNYKNNIPVLINLISINNVIEDVVDLVMEKLNINDKSVIEHLLNNKKINIYLDGLNEITIENNKSRKRVLDVIEQFVKKNNKLNIIVSDRDSDEYSTLNDIPTFILKNMSDEDIKNFIFGNSVKPEIVYNKIMDAVKNNNSLYNEITHPFMLRRLISIVECNKEIPSNASELTGIFLNSIIERERVEKRDSNAKYINRLLMYLAANNESKGGMSIFYILTEFNKCQEEFHFQVDSDEILNLIIKLGILKEVGFEKYAFSEESFEEYYFLEAFDSGLGL